MKSLRNNFNLIWILLGLSLFLLGCSGQTVTPNAPKKTSLQIAIAETTDVHGSLFPWDFIENKEAKTSLAHVQSWIKEKELSGSEVVMVDNGDILQGQPTVYYSNFEDTESQHLAAKVMNHLGYASGTVGNHDIEAGHPVYDKIVNEFSFPWLAANAINTKTGQPYFKPYTVINRGGAKIAILGLITPGIPNWLPENIWKGIEFEDMVLTAEKWVKIIKEKENPDLLIGVFHSGVDYTYGRRTADTPRNENATKLVALQVPGFDVVFSGHDHKDWNETLDNGVLLLGSRNAAKSIAVANIQLNWNAASKRWQRKISGEIVDISSFQPDPEYMETFAGDIEKIKTYVSKRVGTFSRTITTRDAMFGDSPFVDLIHQIQLDISNADISFAAPLSFNKTINSGDVYTRDMFKLYKYENLLYTMKLSGQEIKDFLEYSYGLWFNQMKNQNDNLINFKKDKAGNLIKSARTGSYETVARYYNYDSAAGIEYTVDVSQPTGNRITIHAMADGSPFNLEQEYKVAINSYRGNGGGGHLTKGAGIEKNRLGERMLSSTVKDLRYFLMKWIEEKDRIEPKAFGNWKIVPDNWYQQAKEKDYELLYGMK